MDVSRDKEAIEDLYRIYCKYMIVIYSPDAIMTDNYELWHMTGVRQTKQDFLVSAKS